MSIDIAFLFFFLFTMISDIFLLISIMPAPRKLDEKFLHYLLKYYYQLQQKNFVADFDILLTKISHLIEMTSIKKSEMTEKELDLWLNTQLLTLLSHNKLIQLRKGYNTFCYRKKERLDVALTYRTIRITKDLYDDLWLICKKEQFISMNEVIEWLIMNKR